MRTIYLAMTLASAACVFGCREAKTTVAKEPAATESSPNVPQRAPQEALVYPEASRSPAEGRPAAPPGTGTAASTGLGTQVQPPQPGLNPYTAPAFNAVGPIRMGRGSELSGKVPESQQTDVFMTYDPIHVSMTRPEVPHGSKVQLSIYEEGSSQTAWSDNQAVSTGDFLRFKLGPGDLRPGRYRAVVTIDGQNYGSRTFEVSRGDASS